MDDLILGVSAALVVGLFASSNMFCRRCKCSLSASFTFLMISSAASSSSSAKAVSCRNCSGMAVLVFLLDGISDVLPLMPITAWSASVWNGLKRQSSNPAAFNSLVILPSWAVMAITFILLWFRCLIISIPFISGISISMSMMAGCSLCKAVSASVTWLQTMTFHDSSNTLFSISCRSCSCNLSSSRMSILWLLYWSFEETLLGLLLASF